MKARDTVIGDTPVLRAMSAIVIGLRILCILAHVIVITGTTASLSQDCKPVVASLVIGREQSLMRRKQREAKR